MNDRQEKILFVFNVSWFFVSHRLDVARALVAQGHEVHVAAAPDPQSVKRICDEGMFFHPIPLSRKGGQILHEVLAIRALFKIFKLVSPDLIEMATIKPILYGGLLSRGFKRAQVVTWVTGLGYVFIGSGRQKAILRYFVLLAYKAVFNRDGLRVIFENSDDQRLFVDRGVVSVSNSTVVRGAGVDVISYRSMKEPEGAFTVLLATRLLWDKGVKEFIVAAEILKKELKSNIQFVVAGDCDEGNPAAVPLNAVRKWANAGIITWLGHQKDMHSVFARAHVVCLPSYREGLPKVLLEAAACGKPIVTTDVPGCRDVVINEVTGFLVPPRDAESLAFAFRRLFASSGLRVEMGVKGRSLVEREFSVDKIIDETFAVYASLLSQAQDRDDASKSTITINSVAASRANSERVD